MTQKEIPQEKEEWAGLNFWLPLQYRKSLEVITPVPHNKKKAEPTENWWLFLHPAENWGHKANLWPQKWGDGQMKRINTYTAEAATVASNWQEHLETGHALAQESQLLGA